jgi:hypothetical protein
MIYIQKILIKNYPARDKIFIENIVNQVRCPFRDNILIFNGFEYIQTLYFLMKPILTTVVLLSNASKDTLR